MERAALTSLRTRVKDLEDPGYYHTVPSVQTDSGLITAGQSHVDG